MKAILQYGQFTHMIELPERRMEIRIIKPSDEPSLVAIPFDIREVDSKCLEFRVEKQLTEDIWLYKFVREA